MDQHENRDETFAKLADLFRAVFKDPDLAISPATTAADIDGWDSMTHVSLIVAAEQTFGIRFRASEMDGLQDVGGLAALIAAKRGMAAAAH
jgi:acyl carrier protein